MRRVHPERVKAAQQGAPRYNTGVPCIRGHSSDRATVNGVCVECYSLTRKKYNKTSKGKETSRRHDRTDKRSARRHGLSEAEFLSILSAQNNCCAVCLAPLADGWRTKYIDHDHACCPTGRSCGKCVRGVLCVPCNTGLGQFYDDPAVLRRAADYVEKTKL